MKLTKIDPRRILIPEVRVTSRFTPEALEQLRSLWRGMGQAAPILAIKTPEGLVLVDGKHRLDEALANSETTIDVAYSEGDMVDVLTRNLFLDHVRGKHPVSEMRQVVEALSKEYDLGVEQIQEKTGLTRDYVEKLLLISELTPMCLEALDREEITISHAAELVRLKDPVQQDIVVQQSRLYHWTVKDLREHVTEVLKVQETPAPSTAPEEPPAPITVRCRYCGEEHTPAEMVAPPPCPSCASELITMITTARREFEAEQAAKAEQQGGEEAGS